MELGMSSVFGICLPNHCIKCLPISIHIFQTQYSKNVKRLKTGIQQVNYICKQTNKTDSNGYFMGTLSVCQFDIPVVVQERTTVLHQACCMHLLKQINDIWTIAKQVVVTNNILVSQRFVWHISDFIRTDLNFVLVKMVHFLWHFCNFAFPSKNAVYAL